MNTFNNIIIWFWKGGKTLAVALAKKWESVALIEQNPEMYGGTCINIWCIPSKKLLTLSQEKHPTTLQGKAEYYEQAIDETTKLTAFLREKNYAMLAAFENIQIIDGTASFISDHEIKITGPEWERTISGEKIFINTWATSNRPEIPWIENTTKVYTSTELMKAREYPEHLAILGAGFIGLEFASIYADFWCKVTIINTHPNILPNEDEEVVARIRADFEQRGIQFLDSTKLTEINEENNKLNLTLEIENQTKNLTADALLLAVGRTPNIKDLHLKNTNIETTAKGAIKVNEHLQTSVPNIYAIGDVTGNPQFTYISLDDFRIITDQLFGKAQRSTKDRETFAYCSFLNPPFARIGLTEKQALEQGYSIKVWKLEWAAIPKARILGKAQWLLKAVIDEKTGLILGASLYCAEAHEMINIISLAIKRNLPYTALSSHIFTHPTMSEALNDLFKL